jgi:curved DNA-binding protein CbpA
LPEGVVTLLQIAAGDEEKIREAREVTGRSRELVSEAGAFFIEQILFSPDTDSYRVLGLNSKATSSELRRNMALLLRWLHPDVDTDGKRSVFVGRVTRAWNDLKTQERRAAYDRSNLISSAEKTLARTRAGIRKQNKKQTSNRRMNNSGGAQYRRRYGSGPVFGVQARERNGLLHQILLFLFGRAKH